jgi:hypothetical protein
VQISRINGPPVIDDLKIRIPDGCGYSNMNLYTRFGNISAGTNTDLQIIDIFTNR